MVSSSLADHLRRDLHDDDVDDDHLVTALVDVPLLNGGMRLTVNEAMRIIYELSYFVEEHDRTKRQVT